MTLYARYVCPNWPDDEPAELVGCGTAFHVPDLVRDADPYGWVDCPSCGLAFDPDNPSNRRPKPP